MATSNKTYQTNPGSKTNNLKTDSEHRPIPTESGSIASDKVKAEALKPGDKEADSAITSANPAISGADAEYGKTPEEQEPGLSS